MFDNGNERPEAEGGEYSRALELRLDDAAGRAVKVWEYRPDPDIYARALGSAYRLNNGNTLVNFGLRETPHAPVVGVEADASGREVFRVEALHLYQQPTRYRANIGVKAIRGETMLRAPVARFPSFEERLNMRYKRMTHLAAEPFNVYLGDGMLAYGKAPCEAEDIALRFLLHVHPKERGDLPAGRRSSGFDNLDFKFLEHGVLMAGRCHAELRLPEYEIDHIRTGQFAAEDEANGRSRHASGSPASAPWNVEIPLTP